MASCPHCGKVIDVASPYCPSCGKKVKNEGHFSLKKFFRVSGVLLSIALILLIICLIFAIIELSWQGILISIALIAFVIIGIMNKGANQVFREDAYKLLKTEMADKKETQDTIKWLSRYKDEEARELVRRLIEKVNTNTK